MYGVDSYIKRSFVKNINNDDAEKYPFKCSPEIEIEENVQWQDQASFRFSKKDEERKKYLDHCLFIDTQIMAAYKKKELKIDKDILCNEIFKKDWKFDYLMRQYLKGAMINLGIYSPYAYKEITKKIYG